MAAAVLQPFDTSAETSVSSGSYKYKWCRQIARKELDQDARFVLRKTKQLIQNLGREGKVTPDLRNLEDEIDVALGEKTPINLTKFIKRALDHIPHMKIGTYPEQSPREFDIGIVGAGCAGLFTGLIFDTLNDVFKGRLKVNYEILEAAGEERVGGRLYTHKFSAKRHDYYDVGAMRLPNNTVMDRTFQLIKYLGLEGKKIPYIMNNKNYDPAYYNDVHTTGSVVGLKDVYGLNVKMPVRDRIDEDVLEQDPSAVLWKVLRSFLEPIQTQLDAAQALTHHDDTFQTDPVFELLKQTDFMSTRQFLRSKQNIGLPEGPGYNFNTINYLETFTFGTGWFDQALAETVLETLDFHVCSENSEICQSKRHRKVVRDPPYYCLDGGAQQIAVKMKDRLVKKPEFNRQVVAINANDGNPATPGPVKLTVQDTNLPGTPPNTREYFAVFNSTTLGALQQMDLTKAGLLYGTKQAIRSLHYESSCKVAMKFKSGWWMKEPFNNKGGLGKTDLPLRVCVYPSYNINDDLDDTCVLLCSYTWGQDAQRLGALISSKNDDELLRVLFHDMALLHKNDKYNYAEMIDLLRDQYLEHHAWDWYKDPKMAGAFAYFGPGQFTNLWPEIIRPNALGRLYFIGEAASAHHAWIVGALESAVRGVYSLFQQLHCAAKADKNEDAAKIYLGAMKYLANGPADKKPTDLPCYPLPNEMPERQLSTSLKDQGELKDHLEGIQDDEDLQYITAQVVLSNVETYVDERLKEQTMGRDKAAASQAQVVV